MCRQGRARSPQSCRSPPAGIPDGRQERGGGHDKGGMSFSISEEQHRAPYVVLRWRTDEHRKARVVCSLDMSELLDTGHDEGRELMMPSK